jgi:hypothetical protein
LDRNVDVTLPLLAEINTWGEYRQALSVHTVLYRYTKDEIHTKCNPNSDLLDSTNYGATQIQARKPKGKELRKVHNC